MRQRKLKWADEFIDNSDLIIKEFPVDLKGNYELEIGCGKGNFINKKAIANPNINYLGIDLQKSVLAIAAKKASENNLTNVKFAYKNAIELSEAFINKFNCLYLNFSDPWPKARHEKRRLTSLNFQKVYDNLLISHGLIIFRTDNYGLYLYSSESLNSEYFEIIENIEDVALNEGDIISEYEEKFRNNGNKIYKIVARRRK